MSAPAAAEGHVGDLNLKTDICTCFTDVDKNRWKKIAEKAPEAKGYTDYRQMFDKHAKEIDAVFVAVPDHSHAAASLIAMKLGKHVYCEKPLTWSITEARAMAEAATKYKVATQMGNQGHANEGNRRVVEWVRGGLIGDVTEVHTWTNRPIWPQGVKTRPATIAVPDGLDWDSWIGPAPMRDYHDGLHPFKWRGWFDFGCGAIGDMGCHTWDCVFWSMNPDYPTSIELLEIKDANKETFPSGSHFKWTFPAKDKRPGFVAHWYDGGMKPEVPDEMKKDPYFTKDGKVEAKLPGSASIFIGTKGKLFVEGDYGNSPSLIPHSFHEQTKEQRDALPKIEKSPGHRQEFVMAARGEKPIDFPGSNFAGYAGPLTEVMLLGAIAQKLGEVGGKIECDPVKRTILTKEALALASREYRKGWEL